MMNLSGAWRSKDDKYTLTIEEKIDGNYPIKITMPFYIVSNGIFYPNLQNENY